MEPHKMTKCYPPEEAMLLEAVFLTVNSMLAGTDILAEIKDAASILFDEKMEVCIG